MKYPNPNMLLYIGIGDAYAAATEYIKLPRDQATLDEALKFEHYVKHPTHHDLEIERYTDDEEMEVGNSWVLIENEPPYVPLMFTNSWVREFARGGMRKGYSRKFQEFLERTKTGEEFLAHINPNSNKNGAAMRSVVFGVLPKVEQVLEVATMQAKITHNTSEGLFSARAVALMSHYALYSESSLHTFLPDYCVKHLPKEDIERYEYVFSERWDGSPVCGSDKESVAITTVRAVLEAVTSHSGSSLLPMLKKIILWGGDTDSVAAIAMGIAGIRAIGNAGLPDFMFTNLEHGDPKTGAKYLLDVGTRLMEKFK